MNASQLFRGVREGSVWHGRGTAAWSFWAPRYDLARQFGPRVFAASLAGDARLVDLTAGSPEDSDYISGADIDAACPGLADAIGVEADAWVEVDRLWHVVGEDIGAVAERLRENGFQGLVWWEDKDSDQIAFLIADEAVLENIEVLRCPHCGAERLIEYDEAEKCFLCPSCGGCF